MSVFLSLDFLYIPCRDVDDAAARLVEQLGAELVWKVRGMGTVVACVRPSAEGPLLLLSGHLAGEAPILVYRVADHADTVARLRASGLDLRTLEIPHGPCSSFEAGGQRLAVYELVRPAAGEYFAGRIDEP